MLVLTTANAELAQRAVHPLAGHPEVARPAGDFYQQRIVVRRNHRAAVRRRPVQADAETGRRAVGLNLAVIGNEVVGGVFGGYPALQRETVQRHLVLARQVHFRSEQAVTLRHLNLAANQVDAGDHFGDRVFHLDARVHFDEEPLAAVHVVKELHRAGVVIAGGATQPQRGIAQRGAGFGRDLPRRGHLHHFLVPALHRAVALEKVQQVAVRVAEDLHFQVARAPDVPLQKNGAIPECRRRFGVRFGEAGVQIGRPRHHPHAASAAPKRRFNNQRKPDRGSRRPRFLHRLQRAGRCLAG